MGSEINETSDTSAKLSPERKEYPMERLLEDGSEKASGSDLLSIFLDMRV